LSGGRWNATPLPITGDKFLETPLSPPPANPTFFFQDPKSSWRTHLEVVFVDVRQEREVVLGDVQHVGREELLTWKKIRIENVTSFGRKDEAGAPQTGRVDGELP
jgi:hypothetical protein